MVVGEQAATDRKRLLEQRLGVGEVPLKVEVGRQVVVARGGLGVVFADKAAGDLLRLFK